VTSGVPSLERRDHAFDRRWGIGLCDGPCADTVTSSVFPARKTEGGFAESIECFRGSPAHCAAKLLRRARRRRTGSSGLRVSRLIIVAAVRVPANGPHPAPLPIQSRQRCLFWTRTGSANSPARSLGVGGRSSPARVNSGRRRAAKACFNLCSAQQTLALASSRRPAIHPPARPFAAAATASSTSVVAPAERWLTCQPGDPGRAASAGANAGGGSLRRSRFECAAHWRGCAYSPHGSSVPALESQARSAVGGRV